MVEVPDIAPFILRVMPVSNVTGEFTVKVLATLVVDDIVLVPDPLKLKYW
jgi:hypothetical protein